MSKVESILFDADEGPVSSLLRQVGDDRNGTTTTTSSRSTTGSSSYNNNNDNLHRTDSIMTSTSQQERQIPLQNHGNSRPQRIDTSTATATTRAESVVSFVGCNISPSSAISPQSVLSDDHSSTAVSQQQQQQQQLLLQQEQQQSSNNATIRKLREQIQTIQNELQEERTLRKRKEKSILKLAKELTSRSIDEHRNHVKIDELHETIQDLEHRLFERNRTIQITIPELHQKNEQLNQSIISYRKQIQSLQAQYDMIKSREKSIQKTNQMSLLLQSPKNNNNNNNTSITTGTVLQNQGMTMMQLLTSPPIIDTESDDTTTTTATTSIATSVDSTTISLLRRQGKDGTNRKENITKEERELQLFYGPSLFGELSERSVTPTTTERCVTPTISNRMHINTDDNEKEIHSTTYIQRTIEESERKSNTNHTINESLTKNVPKKQQHYNIVLVFCLILIIIIIVVVIGNESTTTPWTHYSIPELQNHIRTKSGNIMESITDGICSPVRPGTIWTTRKSIIDPNGGSSDTMVEYIAPWWVPSSSSLSLSLLSSSYSSNMKEYLFNRICNFRQRTRIEFHHNSIAIYGCTDTDVTKSCSSNNKDYKKSTKPIWKMKVLGDRNVITISSNEIIITRSQITQHAPPKRWNTNHHDNKHSMSTTTNTIVTKQVTIEHIKAPWTKN